MSQASLYASCWLGVVDCLQAVCFLYCEVEARSLKLAFAIVPCADQMSSGRPMRGTMVRRRKQMVAQQHVAPCMVVKKPEKLDLNA